jgi:DNA transformation protein
MPVSPNFRDFVLDQLSGLDVRARRMFGGIGLYGGELFFGVIDDDVVYFKVDDSNRADYTTRGCEPFRPYGDDTVSMSYFRVPSDVLEDIDEIKMWARKAISVAANAKTQPKKKKNQTGVAAKKRKRKS